MQRKQLILWYVSIMHETSPDESLCANMSKNSRKKQHFIAAFNDHFYDRIFTVVFHEPVCYTIDVIIMTNDSTH